MNDPHWQIVTMDGRGPLSGTDLTEMAARWYAERHETIEGDWEPWRSGQCLAYHHDECFSGACACLCHI